MRFRHLQLFLFIIAFSCILTKSKGSEDFSSTPNGGLGFRYLSSATPDGFLEYDFQPDGTLFFYWFSEAASSSGPDVKVEYFEPIFGVEKQRWIFNGSELTIYRGGKKVTFELKQSDRKVSWGEFSALKVDKLNFLEAVQKYTASKSKK